MICIVFIFYFKHIRNVLFIFQMESSIDVLTGVITEATPYSEIKKFDLEKDIDKSFIGSVHLLKAVAKKVMSKQIDGLASI